jgi:hypothetical protein
LVLVLVGHRGLKGHGGGYGEDGSDAVSTTKEHQGFEHNMSGQCIDALMAQWLSAQGVELPSTVRSLLVHISRPPPY